MLSSDKPIQLESEDFLGFSHFADALSLSLTEMAPDEGIVISLEGAWGSGKTSAIQLVERRLIIRELARELNKPIDELAALEWSVISSEWENRRASRRSHVIRFNPWNFSGQENLVRAFFTEVGAVVGHPADGAVAVAIKRITDYLPTIGTVVGAGTSLVAGGAATAGVAATAGRAVGEGAQRLFDRNLSLESSKRELAKALKEAEKRVVVVIDDIDRLLPSEMRAIFSLVKSLGDLPNLLYVLSFDRAVVSSVLKAGIEPIDPEFLEKVIQVQLKLPPPWQAEIRSLFFSKVNEVTGDVGVNDEGRWQVAFFEAIAPYIRTPRDVARFRNTLQVIWPNVVGDVDLTDLLLLITLQLSEPAIFDLVFENIEELSGESVSYLPDEKFASRFDPVGAKNEVVAKKLLGHLFPSLARGWNRHDMDGVPYMKKREQRRICTKEYYRNYFLFGREESRVSKYEIEAMLSSSSPEASLSALLSRLEEKPERLRHSPVGNFLDQLAETVHSKPFLSDGVLRALLDQSDRLILRADRRWEFFVEDNLRRLDSILKFGLTPLSAEQRLQRLETLCSHQTGLTLASVMVHGLGAQHGLFGDDKSKEIESYIAEEDVIEAAEKIVDRIRTAAADGSLLKSPRPIRLIFGWRWMGDVKHVRYWLQNEIKIPSSVLRLAEILPTTIYRSTDSGREEIRKFDSERVSAILDVDDFKSALASAVREEGTSESKQIEARFLEAEALGRSGDF